jgi:hypothetical protein
MSNQERFIKVLEQNQWTTSNYINLYCASKDLRVYLKLSSYELSLRKGEAELLIEKYHKKRGIFGQWFFETSLDKDNPVYIKYKEIIDKILREEKCRNEQTLNQILNERLSITL